jgi:sodium-dependent dicarboxylate transporter 2/3/5
MLFCLLRLLPVELISRDADIVIAVAIWMLVWWITEAVSISVTALLPLMLFPLFKVMPMAEVGANYGSPIVFLFFGGFVLALALEKVNLHKRIALSIINWTGNSPNRVVLGFMLSTALMSMWISNTASTVVMLPIAISVIQLLINDADGFTRADKNFALCLMLGIAFSANAGGIATVIGTPPNSVLIGLLENQYQIEISFLRWMVFGLPFSSVLVLIVYLVLVKWLFPCKDIRFTASADLIKQELINLGKTSPKERHVLLVFAVVVSLWVFRSLLNSLLPGLNLSDTMISIFGALLLFAVPHGLWTGDFILEWKDTQQLAWGILILFGGGLALAKAMSATGIVDLIAGRIAEGNLGILFTAGLLIALMLFMTELMSNVALTAVLAPVVAGIAIGLDIPITHLLIPVTVASSCAFMLPMATPPNAIVFASGLVEVKQMAKAGIVLNLISVVLLILALQYLIPYLF